MTSLTCTAVIRDFVTPAATITLDETQRHRRRMRMVSDRMENGAAITFLLDLPQARLLSHGDGLLLSDGRIVEVRAAPEPLMRITARDPRHLTVLAWQIGNRHLAAEIGEDAILIRRDHVIRAMLEGLGATIEDIDAPFSPEGGAYGDAHAQAHLGQHHHHGDHDHGHDHHHHHDHRHSHDHDHSHG